MLVLHKSTTGRVFHVLSKLNMFTRNNLGGQGQFAEVVIKFEPLDAGSGYEFKSEIKGGTVPKEYIPGVAKGLEECMNNGVLVGFAKVVMPEDHLGDVIGDLNSRRGQINSFGDKPGGMKVIDSLVPLSEMFQYVSTLRGMTKGRTQYTMQLSKFDIVPQHIQKQIAAKAQSTAAA